MNTPTSELSASLAAVRDALHCAALRDAAQALAAAGDHAAAAESNVQRSATEIRTRARDAGGADAHAAIEIERARVRRRGRAAVLRARLEAYQTLRAQTRVAISALRDTPDYPALRAAMVAAVARRLGPDAEITEADGGGVSGRLGDRRVDLSFTAMADRAADAVAAGLEQP
jgi:vacuolar-type H+-ATPase subunit E/Vma4